MDKTFYKTLVLIVIPIMVQEFINSFVNILDTFMIGLLGVHEITAVGLANQMFFLFILITFGINSGASILMGQFWGAQDVKSVKKTLGVCICASLVSAGIFSAGAFFYSDIIMSVYSKDARVIEIGGEYLKIIWVSYVITAITLSFGTALKSVGITKVPMFATIIALCANVLFNYIFIFVLNMGVKGAATATVIARAFELTAITTVIFCKDLPIKAKLHELFSANRQFIKNYIVIGMPVLLNEAIWAFGVSIYNVAYKHCGTNAQGAMQIASTAQNLFMVIGISIGFGSGIMIAHRLGAGDVQKAVEYSRRFMKIAFLCGAVMGGLLSAAAPLIAGIFNVTEQVKNDAVKIMFVFALAMAVRNFNFVTIVGVLRSGGDTWFCFILDAAAVWLIGIPLAFLGAYFLELPIYVVYALVTPEEAVKMLLSGRRVLRNKWARTLV